MSPGPGPGVPYPRESAAAVSFVGSYVGPLRAGRPLSWVERYKVLPAWHNKPFHSQGPKSRIPLEDLVVLLMRDRSDVPLLEEVLGSYPEDRAVPDAPRIPAGPVARAEERDHVIRSGMLGACEHPSLRGWRLLFEALVGDG